MEFPFFPPLRAGTCIPDQWRLDDFGDQALSYFLACFASVALDPLDDYLSRYFMTTDVDANLAPKYLQTFLPVSLVPFQSRVYLFGRKLAVGNSNGHLGIYLRLLC